MLVYCPEGDSEFQDYRKLGCFAEQTLIYSSDKSRTFSGYINFIKTLINIIKILNMHRWKLQENLVHFLALTSESPSWFKNTCNSEKIYMDILSCVIVGQK